MNCPKCGTTMSQPKGSHDYYCSNCKKTYLTRFCCFYQLVDVPVDKTGEFTEVKMDWKLTNSKKTTKQDDLK